MASSGRTSPASPGLCGRGRGWVAWADGSLTLGFRVSCFAVRQSCCSGVWVVEMNFPQQDQEDI
jgi:hypothetical protein